MVVQCPPVLSNLPNQRKPPPVLISFWLFTPPFYKSSQDTSFWLFNPPPFYKSSQDTSFWLFTPPPRSINLPRILHFGCSPPRSINLPRILPFGCSPPPPFYKSSQDTSFWLFTPPFYKSSQDTSFWLFNPPPFYKSSQDTSFWLFNPPRSINLPRILPFGCSPPPVL